MNPLIKKKRHLKCISNPHYSSIVKEAQRIVDEERKKNSLSQVELVCVTKKAFLKYLKRTYASRLPQNKEGLE